MQAFQLLKLSIFPVMIAMRILDRQETSCAEYQVALHVHFSTQRIAMYMPAHTHTHTHTLVNHPQAQNTYAQSHTYTHMHPDSITQQLVTHKHTY